MRFCYFRRVLSTEIETSKSLMRREQSNRRSVSIIQTQIESSKYIDYPDSNRIQFDSRKNLN